MATNDGRLDPLQKVSLAEAISERSMENIALGYLGFDEDELDSLQDAHKDNVCKINRKILEKWCNKNSGNTQTKVSVRWAS